MSLAASSAGRQSTDLEPTDEEELLLIVSGLVAKIEAPGEEPRYMIGA